MEKSSATNPEGSFPQNPEACPETFSFPLRVEESQLQEADIEEIVRQVDAAMREFTGVSVSDLKLLFSANTQRSDEKNQNAITSSVSNSLKSKSDSFARAVEGAKSSVKLFPTSSLKEDGDLQEQIDHLQVEREELKKRLRESSSELDRWQTTCNQQQEWILRLEKSSLGVSSTHSTSMDTSSHSLSSSSKRRGVSRTPAPNAPKSFPQNDTRARRSTLVGAEMEELRKRLVESRQELEKTRILHKEETRRWDNERANLQTKLAEVQRKLDDCNAAYKEQIEDAKQELDKCREASKNQASTWKKEKERQYKLLREANRAADELRSKVEEQRTEKETLKRETVALQKQLKALQNNVDRLESENTSRQQSVEQLEEENKALVGKLQGNNERLNSLRESMGQRVAELETIVTDQRAQLEEQEAKLEESQQQLKGCLDRTISEQQKEIEDQRLELDSSRRQLNDCKQELEEFKIAQGELKVQMQYLKSENDKLLDELHSNEEKADSLKTITEKSRGQLEQVIAEQKEQLNNYQKQWREWNQELDKLRAASQEQALRWQMEKEGFSQRTTEETGDVEDWKTFYQQQQSMIESLKKEATASKEQAKNMRSKVQMLEADNRKYLCQVQSTQSDKYQLSIQLQQSLDKFDELKNGTEKRVEEMKRIIEEQTKEIAEGGSNLKDCTMNLAEAECELKKVKASHIEQVERLEKLVAELNNEIAVCQRQLQSSQKQLEDLGRDKRELQSKVQNQEEIILTARAAVGELEDALATQQLQIQSLSLLNQEQRGRLVFQDDESETESLPSLQGSLDSFDGCNGKAPEENASSIEKLETLWAQQRAEVESIQKEQDNLFHKLGKQNSDATSKIDKLYREFAKEDGAEVSEQQKDVLETGKMLNGIEEEPEIDSSSIDSEAVIEQFELAWRKQTEEIRALQRDQDILLARMRASSGDNAKEEVDNIHDGIKLSKAVLEKENGIIRSMHSENTRLIQKLLQAETEKLELEREVEEVCEQQQADIVRLKQEKAKVVRELERKTLLLEKVEAFVDQQKETIDCLRSQRLTLEAVVEDHRQRTQDLDSVCTFQKTVIDSLQAEKNSLVKRLLDTEGDFRSHLTTKLTTEEELSDLKSKLALAAGNGTLSKDAFEEILNARDLSFTATEATVSDDDEEVFDASVDDDNDWDDGEEDMASVASNERIAHSSSIMMADKEHAEEALNPDEVLRLMSFSFSFS